MEYDNQVSNSNASSPCLYMTAPTSPNEYTTSSSMYYYYSAPASPRRKPGYAFVETRDDNLGSNLDDFEFETSKRFSGQLQSDTSESPVRDGPKYQHGDLLPAMAFADELFHDGLVMPLRLPPRLQTESDQFNSFCQRSPIPSPRTVCRIPFSRKSSWNDDFDPFMVALEKVREEKRGRNSHHRRSRSYSPFRAISKSFNGTADCCNQDFPKGDNQLEPMQVPPGPPPSHSGPLDFKGSAYARWVRDQTQHGLSPKSPRWFITRQRTRPLKTEQDGSDKPILSTEKHVGKKSGNDEESKVQKLKGFLMRYASFGRENSGSKKTKTRSEPRKLSYFGRLSFKFKGNVQSNGKRKMAPDTTMAVVEYNPSVALCMGYGVGSPIKVQ